MRDYTRFRQHLETLRKTVYREPKIDYHEKIIDSAFDAFVKNGSFKDVLDVGFGTGYSLEKFKKLDINPIGITLDNNELQGALLLHYDVRLMDMAFLEFEDEKFDLVWCRHALEHSVMPLIVLMEFKRVLKDGGNLYLEMPSDNVVHLDNANHYSLFSDAAWQSLFKKVGFRLLFRGQFSITMTSFTDIYWQYWLKNE